MAAAEKAEQAAKRQRVDAAEDTWLKVSTAAAAAVMWRARLGTVLSVCQQGCCWKASYTNLLTAASSSSASSSSSKRVYGRGKW